MKNNYQTTTSIRSKKQISNYVLLLVVLLMSSSSLKAQVPSYVPTNGLVGWWPFNGNANDESGNGNNGTNAVGSYTFDRNNASNSSFYGSGSGSGINISNLNNFPFGNDERTISIWFQCDIPYIGGDRTLFTYGDNTFGTRFSVYTTGTFIGVEYMNGSVLSPFNPDNVWHNIIASYNGTGSNGIILYLDGITLSNTTISNPINVLNTANSFIHNIGNLNNIYNFGGKYDDIGIWNRVLSQQEITALYNGCQLSINSQPTNQNITVNNNAQFIVNSSDSNATYQWQTDLGIGFQNLSSVGQYSGVTNDTLTVSYVTFANNNQPFRCIVSSGSCSDTSNVAVLTVNNNVGINEISANQLFSVYPNPTSTVINLKSDVQLLGATYFIYDNLGKTILSGKVTSENMPIDLNQLVEGIYLIGIDENGVHSKKQSFKVIK